MRSSVLCRPLARLVSCDRRSWDSRPRSPRWIVPFLWSRRTSVWLRATASTMYFSQSWRDMKLASAAKSVIRIVTYTRESCCTSLMRAIFLSGARYWTSSGFASMYFTTGVILLERREGSTSPSSSLCSSASSGSTYCSTFLETSSWTSWRRAGTDECCTSVAMRWCLSLSASMRPPPLIEGRSIERVARSSREALTASWSLAFAGVSSPLETLPSRRRFERVKICCIAHAWKR
mmetsp:Transcript_35290/g.83568  ORF Transcript_35290/g.83568 Transcript_35290/m.83568 type:complete len:234 (-) Transcript_35290:956-1657(-)